MNKSKLKFCTVNLTTAMKHLSIVIDFSSLSIVCDKHQMCFKALCHYKIETIIHLSFWGFDVEPPWVNAISRISLSFSTDWVKGCIIAPAMCQVGVLIPIRLCDCVVLTKYQFGPPLTVTSGGNIATTAECRCDGEKLADIQLSRARTNNGHGVNVPLPRHQSPASFRHLTHQYNMETFRYLLRHCYPSSG